MFRSLFLLFLPLLLLAEEYEIRLPTRLQLKPIYLSRLHTSETDWRYCDELREVLETDLATNGFCTLVPSSDTLEHRLAWPDVRHTFQVAPWKQDHVAYVFAIQAIKGKFQLVAFNIENGSSKRYPEMELTGKLDQDRSIMHKMADQLQKDIFGLEGVASLRILYTQRQKVGEDWISEIWVCDSDGANAHKILTEKGYCVSPGFFPGKKGEFFYVTFSQGQSKIYRSALHKKVGEPMIVMRGSQVLPAVNAKATQMTFISDIAGRPDLFIQNLDNKGNMVGKARQLFSAPRATQATSTFSPDGKKLAFVSDKDGPPRIYQMEILSPNDTKRATPRLLTKVNRDNTSPTWSPDGSKIAYVSRVDGIRQIWIYDFETEEEIQLTTSPEDKENPSWAPDSMHLVYNTESDDLCELYVIHLNKKEPVQISKGPDQKRFPCWELR